MMAIHGYLLVNQMGGSSNGRIHGDLLCEFLCELKLKSRPKEYSLSKLIRAASSTMRILKVTEKLYVVVSSFYRLINLWQRQLQA